MLVIMVLGVSAVMLGSLNSKVLRISSANKNSDALAQAKEALIAYSTSSDSPGSLPCPDTSGTGVANTAADCPHYVGLLPWKTLGLPDLRDSTGSPLWYALSRNFRKDPSNSINSDTVGTLTITGSPSASQAVAIIFAPGPNIGNQSRSGSTTAYCSTTNTSIAQNLCAANYLEDNNANPSPKTGPNTQYISGDTSNIFNDQVNFITAENFIPNVEKRIAREVKQCLDDYAAQPSETAPTQRVEKYPWAVPISSGSYTSNSGTLFGRIPDAPVITTTTNEPLSPSNTSDARVLALLNALAALESAVNGCLNSDTSTHRNALDDAGDYLEKKAKLVRDNQPTTPAIPSSVTNPAITAGDKAQDSGRCGDIHDGSSHSVQNNLNSANTALSNIFVSVPGSPEDSSMPSTWPTSCILSDPVASYWPNWRDQTFYRVADAYRPNGSKICNSTCLALGGNGNPNIGSGSYRAIVIVAGKNIASTTRSYTDISTYLEGANSSAASTTTLETWQATERRTKNINDIAVCIDGKGATPNSKCY